LTVAGVELRLAAAAAPGAARRGPGSIALVEPEDARVAPMTAPPASRIANTPLTIVERLIFKLPLSVESRSLLFRT
jgi:hypothetical protein